VKKTAAPAPLVAPISPLVGDLNPAHFVAIHKNRLERLEEALAFVESLTTPAAEAARLQQATEGRHEVDGRIEKLLWGVPCGGCGSAESLCCCDQGP
jgi:hypothetical protein